ncbi:MAG: AmmeMemoRadiSam system protein A [Candidatus Omnitrophica bacterium]|nr:AmmeMemoRadiSam system protein A [Candidatus Omnitrophota bacterium]
MDLKKMLTELQKKKLLRIARETLEYYLSGKELPVILYDDPILQERRGVFVTLKKKGELRGCIGYIEGVKPLAMAVRDMAIQSATGDPRFPPVNYKELKDIDIEISVLTPLKKVKDAEEIVMGKDGVIIKKGYRQGVFLPQVAEETGWTKEEFLGNLCMYKAGLPPDAWKDKDTEIYTFQAEVFSERGI